MIIVTGDRGFIGSELKQYLTAQGHDVHGLDWHTRGRTYTANTPIEWIFHMGAISETNADNWEDIVRKNIKDTQDWITTAERWGCGITYASSASVYGSWSNSPEWGPVQPQHMYGVSKLAIDNWVAEQNFSVPVQGMRFFNVYGRNEAHKSQPSPIRTYMQQAIAGEPLKVWHHNGRLGTRDFVSVDDCISAMIQLKDARVSGVYNVGTGVQLTFADIAHSIQRRFDNVQVQSVPMPEHMVEKYQWESRADLNKLQTAISWNPQSVDQWLDNNFDILYNKIINENT
jgi:ADP-L-glycero-D-manno-heptose 6-epimerase